MQAEPRLFWEPLDARARERLWSLLATFKAGHPLAPVSIVVPSTYAALDLRHELGRQPSVNVHLMVLPRLTELLGAPSLADQGRRPLTPLVEAAAVRRVAGEAQGPLSAVKQHAALQRTLRDTFRDLRHATEEGLSRLATQGPLRAEVVRLYRLFLYRTDPHYYDREALAEAAAREVRRGSAPGLRDLGPLVFFLVTDLSPGEQSLIAALEEHWTCAVVLGLSGDQAADGPVYALADRLAPILGLPQQGPPLRSSPVSHLVVTPDPQQEVRWALRRLLRTAEEGVPFRRMAILYRNSATYADLVQEELTRAGVPAAGPNTRPLSETGAGRTLLGLVRLAGSDLPRADLTAWLTGCPVAPPGMSRLSIQASHWDAISRRAGVVGGPGQWRQRLERYAWDIHKQMAEALEQGDISEARASRMEEEATAARSLVEVVADLVDRLRPPADGSGWPAFTRWASGLLEAYLDRNAAPPEAAEAEEAAWRRIQQTLAEMETLDDVDPRVSLEVFRLALEEALSSPLGHLGQTGRGVFVAPLGATQGMSFDLVCVLGMVEGAVPPLHADDPLLPDRERQRAGGSPAGIASRSDRDTDERYLYLAALAAGKDCILSFPRSSPGAQRGQFPSRWFLEAARQLHGAPVYTSTLSSLASAGWLTVVSSLEDGLRAVATESAAHIHDRDVHFLWRWRNSGRPVPEHYLAASGHLSRALALAQGRAEHRLSPWDGDVSSLQGRARRLDLLDRAALSPTSLETWATCPFRYLMGHVLGVASLERPEEVWSISPLEKGALVHGVLDDFLRAVQEEGSLPGPGEAWSREHRDLLHQLARQVFADAQSRGVIGKALLWEMEQEAMMSDLDAFLECDAQLRARFGVTPYRAEVGFGLSMPPGGGPVLPPAQREVPGVGTLRFRGAVDRVDRDVAGRFALVLDYKTGSARPYEALKKDPVDAGRRLQLPIYALALQDYLGEKVSVSAAYWFISSRGGFALFPPEPVSLSQVENQFDAAVGTIARGITAGLFPPNPGPEDRGGFANCSWCDFDTLCPARRDVVWQRKQADPRLREYRRLQGGTSSHENGGRE